MLFQTFQRKNDLCDVYKVLKVGQDFMNECLSLDMPGGLIGRLMAFLEVIHACVPIKRTTIFLMMSHCQMYCIVKRIQQRTNSE